MGFKSLIYRLSDALAMPRDFCFCLMHGLGYDVTWRFYGLPCIRTGFSGGKIILGKRFAAVSKNSHNSFGIIQPVVLKVVGLNATIKIGDDVGISGSTLCAESSITVGDHVLIGSGCLIADNDSHPINPDLRRVGGCGGKVSPIVIEDDVFLGARAIVLKGVRIGKGSVVGAGSVVTRDIPPFSIAVGNPARVVGDTRQK